METISEHDGTGVLASMSSWLSDQIVTKLGNIQEKDAEPYYRHFTFAMAVLANNWVSLITIIEYPKYLEMARECAKKPDVIDQGLHAADGFVGRGASVFVAGKSLWRTLRLIFEHHRTVLEENGSIRKSEMPDLIRSTAALIAQRVAGYALAGPENVGRSGIVYIDYLPKKPIMRPRIDLITGLMYARITGESVGAEELCKALVESDVKCPEEAYDLVMKILNEIMFRHLQKKIDLSKAPG